ncbi:DUF255 domain-containing protein [Desulfosarcina sp. OttesenSCG-928-G10]|nr:DUF255 domain-containing protein [Desulfosarcina sp. OttesenSCG-928-G10]MDL2321302.1 DUF255 domain-containing protein [Desulfosarcina sp. OttesenSCG-928-B08]
MKNVVTCRIMAAVLGFLLLSPTVALSDNAIQWMPYEEGLHRAAQEGKKVLVVFSIDGCDACRQLDQSFRDPAVIAHVNESFVPISVNAGNRGDIAKQYRVFGYPTLWFVTSAGEPIGGEIGFLLPKDLLQKLCYVSSDSYTHMSFPSFVKKNR